MITGETVNRPEVLASLKKEDSLRSVCFGHAISVDGRPGEQCTPPNGSSTLKPTKGGYFPFKARIYAEHVGSVWATTAGACEMAMRTALLASMIRSSSPETYSASRSTSW